MKNLVDIINESLILEEESEVYVVKDKDDGTIITVCGDEDEADEAMKTFKEDNPDNNYEVVKDKRSNYIN